MKYNFLVDFTENGIDKNEPHIIIGAENEFSAAATLKQILEEKGYEIQMIFVVEGDYTLQQLHDLANYGVGLESCKMRPVYVSVKTLEYFEMLRNNPEEAKHVHEELQQRLNQRCSEAQRP